ncbi:membrane protein insertion efficiency factor YidD [Candidatus Curtissbacteria bacterium RIFCSPHIGHO2_02_FULL_40_17]|uniref:Membrane protein insertion efficiency factor YidD n=4 Tax=Candidatus Curtissiibacteriota TaxID=1752717 RepID=A0A1F5GH78_9BACT|nr:MAG: membrane protein insertion efficiency factor YidD [Candidatus Curtissbacteria bacterium RIFCSPHIGHO2_01_FULL_40_12]OGD91205.1 MAG: membrane protein insertion efficiency factor YidD [Candidatus Curtissbacteria bacterium RIFCSPHIGHO2_02_FULL_40_17]OGE03220.1 MAG: membrane protein insertion efficiency factor YidD [Candidatus Curtissbacteria bacterium RIFCSPHIGHO2_12_FULL_41_17]OGE06202.1 MAG: membrane protein insertion efficiency factor YidD [Candidatus Curtissbacteria bacterium RIFCSPLOWO2
MKQIAIFLIKIYQVLFAGSLPSCRFRPSCSAYVSQAIEKYGILKGSVMGLKRICACHPFSKRPFYDPV